MTDKSSPETRRQPDGFARRAAQFAPDTFNEAARTVDVVFTTGADVDRRDWWTGERWVESLEVSPDAVDLARLNAGGPVLNAHNGFDLGDVIGVVERAWIDGDRGLATLRFSEREDVAPIVADVRAGILRNISVGYQVAEWREEDKGGVKRRTATRWTPMEISFVPIPADPAAQVRSADVTAPARTLAEPAATKESAMTDKVETAPAQPDAESIRAEAVKAERARVAEIREAAKLAGLGDEFTQQHIDAGTAPDAARRAALEALRGRESGAIQPSARIEITRDERETFAARAADALSLTIRGHAPTEATRDFGRLTIHGLMRQIAERAGERRLLLQSGESLVRGFQVRGLHTSSDFTGILAHSANKTIRDMYGAYPNTWSTWCDEIDVDDFKTITAASIGPMPEPIAVDEGGPIRYGSIAEETETYAVQERARIVALSRVAIINDDMRAFERVLSGAALAGYTALRRAVFGVLTTNANMADSIALFNASHSNLGTAGNLSTTTFGELYQLLAQQRSPSRSLDAGETAAPLPPPNSVALIVSPAEYRTALELTSALIQPTAAGNALPAEFRQFTTVVMDAFLNTGNQPYYLARRDIRALEIAYLAGARAPQVMSAEEFDVAGMSFKVMFDFGVKAVTWRTIAANLG